MSKLEDKLAASMQSDTPKSAPATGKAVSSKAAPAKTKDAAPPSKASGSKARKASGSALPDLNDPARPLHPARIWPD